MYDVNVSVTSKACCFIVSTTVDFSKVNDLTLCHHEYYDYDSKIALYHILLLNVLSTFYYCFVIRKIQYFLLFFFNKIEMYEKTLIAKFMTRFIFFRINIFVNLFQGQAHRYSIDIEFINVHLTIGDEG